MVDADKGAAWFGVPVDKWISIIQTVGVPTLFMLFFCFLMWQYVPPIVQGHVDLLRRTGDTLEKMDRTLQTSNAMIADVVEVEKASTIFMEQVHEEHMEALADHQKIMRAINGDK